MSNNEIWILYSKNENKKEKEIADRVIDNDFRYAMKSLFKTAVEAARVDKLAKKYNL